MNEDGTRITGTMADDITVRYLAPEIGLMFPYLDERLNIIWKISVGEFQYENEGQFIDKLKMTGKNTGFSLSLGVDLKLFSDHFAIGIMYSMFLGSMTDVLVDDGHTSTVLEYEDHRESVSRRDLSLGIRAYWQVSGDFIGRYFRMRFIT